MDKPVSAPDWTNIQHMVADARAGICYSPSQISTLSTAMEATNARIDELTKLLEEALKLRDYQVYAQATIRQLPTEVLTRVFRFATPQINLHSTARKSPWNIGCVCKHWRDIFYSTPQLWDTLNIDWWALEHARGLSSYVTRLERFLGHSGSIPVSITLVGYPTIQRLDHNGDGLPPVSLDERKGWGTMLLLLEKELSRLVVVIADLPAQLSLRSGESPPGTSFNFPQATTLEFQHRASLGVLGLRQISLNLPNLQNLVVYPGAILALDVPMVSEVAFSYIKSFVKQQFSPHFDTLEFAPDHTYGDSIRGLLILSEWEGFNEDASQITSLSFQQIAYASHRFLNKFVMPKPIKSVLLRNITHLTIHCFPQNIVQLISSMILPSLQCLKLKHTAKNTAEESLNSSICVAVAKMVRTSGCHPTMKALDLNLSLKVSGSDIIRVLRETPYLETLATPYVTPFWDVLRRQDESTAGNVLEDGAVREESLLLLPRLQITTARGLCNGTGANEKTRLAVDAILRKRHANRRIHFHNFVSDSSMYFELQAFVGS